MRYYCAISIHSRLLGPSLVNEIGLLGLVLTCHAHYICENVPMKGSYSLALEPVQKPGGRPAHVQRCGYYQSRQATVPSEPLAGDPRKGCEGKRTVAARRMRATGELRPFELRLKADEPSNWLHSPTYPSDFTVRMSR